MKFLKINDQLFISQQEVKQMEEVKVEIKNTHYLFIADCSGSMYSEISKVKEHIKKKARLLKSGDTISIARFSGQGDCEFFLKGFKLESQDYAGLDKLCDKHLRSTGLTCFSEILKDSRGVIDDLKPFGDRFALFFMSDGYPTVSDLKKETENIFKAIKDIGGELASAMIVGYSDYYNKELMSQMAEAFEGTLVHSENINSFELTLEGFISQQNELDDRIKVKVENPSDLGMVFSLIGQNIINYTPVDEIIRFSPTKLKTNFIYSVSSTRPNGEEITGDIDENMLRACYASACLFSQRTKTNLSMDIIGFIGDVFFVDKINNSFTNKEYGSTETFLVEAINDKRSRFIKGKNTNYLPKEDAFCLINAFDLLLEDDNAFLYPRNPAFNYKRRGPKAEPLEGTPEFKEVDNVKCALKNLVWNETRPNLSIQCLIQGAVKFMTDDYKKFNMAPEFNTHVFRNYTIVVDGVLNMDSLPISCSEKTFYTLQANGMFDSNETFEEGKVYVLDLTAIPIMNRQMSKSLNSAETLCRDYFEQNKYEAAMKVYKYFFNKEFQKEDGVLDSYEKLYGPEASAFLKENFISKNGFSPKTAVAPSTDYYIAKEFSIKVAGLSSLPKVEEVIEKMEKGKVSTVSVKLMADAITEYQSHKPDEMTPENRKELLETKMKATDVNLKSTRKKIQTAKFAILLGKQWFREFKSREENSLEIDGNKFTIEVKEKQVNY